MIAQTLRRLSRQKPVTPIYRLLRRVYYEYVRPVLDARRDVRVRSPYQNIYYCCTQRTGSQWFKRVFRDPVVYQYTGLKVFEYVEIGLRQARFSGPLPAGTICSHLYIGHPTYVEIPKPAAYRSFFVVRDPRDVAVSWYFAARYSHGLVGPIGALRHDLEDLSLQDGLRYSIASLDKLGLFWAQRSWLSVSDERRDARIFRYEDFAADSQGFLQGLFAYLGIELPADQFAALHDRHQFKKVAGGRERGTENPRDHYRKGIAGD
jgi:Sulfotransferase domain